MALTRREEKLLRGLRQRKIREAEGCFLVEGVRAVEDLLASELRTRFVVFASSIEDTQRGRELRKLVARNGVPIHEVSGSAFNEYAETQSPQGVLAVAEIPHWRFADLTQRVQPAVVLVLDGVQDPGNFGTLVRTAEALGAVGVLALPGTVDPWNAKAIRSSMGSSFRLPIVAAPWSEAAPLLREMGYAILATAAGGETLDFRPPYSALIVGNEGGGISAETLRDVDRTIGIPIRGRAESLNVTAAAAILLYELLR